MSRQVLAWLSSVVRRELRQKLCAWPMRPSTKRNNWGGTGSGPTFPWRPRRLSPEGASMQLTTETFGHVMVVHTPDELTEDTATGFLDALDSVIGQGHVQLVLEMDRSEAYDSAGLNVLLDLQERVLNKGGS